MSSTNDIRAKWQECKNRGLNLGNAVGAEQDAGTNGRVQVYQNGRIYWHENTGAHEVHGGILAKYLEMGGPGTNSATGKRDLGFPTTDEITTPDGIYPTYPVSRFEWGEIAWCSGVGAVSIYGDYYKISRVVNPILGHVLTDPLPCSEDGETVYFQRGCLFKFGFDEMVYKCIYDPHLMIGRPKLSTLGEIDLDAMFIQGIGKDVWQRLQNLHSNFLTDIWQNRFIFQAVKNRAERVQLSVVFDRSSEHSHNNTISVYLKLKLAPGAAMSDRTLYNICLALPDGNFYPVSPHAVYARKDWQKFGIIHATDTHISQRCDDNYRKLVKLGRNESEKEYCNYNEGFRELIRQANRLHAKGSLDLIIVTGDLVDYQYEDNDPNSETANLVKRRSDGNLALFEKIILGNSPSPKGRPVEELQVPIFLTLGNHDYRRIPYKLVFQVDTPIISEPCLKNFASHNLTEEDAIALEPPSPMDVVLGRKYPAVSEDMAVEMVKVNTPTLYDRNYVIELGPHHRIVMLNSKHDLGVIEGKWDAIKVHFGYGSDDMKSFADGAPNQVGFSSEHLFMIKQALAEAANEGVVIVGVHGPPLNIKGNEFNHFFRETEHPTADEKDIIGYLIRQGQSVTDISHPNWMNSIGFPYFMHGDVADLLDHDTSQGEVNNFLKLCAGESVGSYQVSRPVDLVLCGHGHNNVEYRVKWDNGKKEMQFFTDFYTENPKTYYGSRKAVADVSGKARVAITVKEGAKPNGVPVKVRDHRAGQSWEGDMWRLDVPPYPKPLSSATDFKAWWSQHRPLILQTGSTGAIETRSNTRKEPGKMRPDPSFRGYRLITVDGKYISAIRYVKLA